MTIIKKIDQNWIQINDAVVSMQYTYIHRIVNVTVNFMWALLLTMCLSQTLIKSLAKYCFLPIFCVTSAYIVCSHTQDIRKLDATYTTLVILWLGLGRAMGLISCENCEGPSIL